MDAQGLEDPSIPASFPRQAGAARVLLGLIQGIALYLLYQAFEAKAWPATNPQLFAALTVCAVLTPLVIASGLTHLRALRLLGWALIVTMVCAGLAVYDIGRDAPQAVLRRTPSFQFSIIILAGLYIAHSLIIAHAGAGRRIAPYPQYFGAAWKIGLQTALAALFACALWLVLWFGAELFHLIRIEVLARLIRQSWFQIPVTALAFNCALHVTDVRDGMVRALRTLACNLLAWLLPLMALIAATFILALPFTGVELLWNTRHAAPILLGGAAGLIVLINMAYQDGRAFDEPRTAPHIFRLSILVASAVLFVLVPLAAYGLALRIGQYGWTPDRVFAVACSTVAACYAAGYAFAALRQPSLRPIQVTNVVTSGVIVTILIALVSPIADPARISVADQVHRLRAGKVDPAAFDYRFLRFEAGRFGVAALQDLARQTDRAVVAQRSAEMLARKDRYEARVASLSADERAGNIMVGFPTDAPPLPRDFLETDWLRPELRFLTAPCLTSPAKCNALLIDIDGDGTTEIVLLPLPSGQGSVYRAVASGGWTYAGTLLGSGCIGMRDLLLAGKFDLVASTGRTITVNGRELPIQPRVDCAALTGPKP